MTGCHDSQAENYEAEVRNRLDDYIRENYFEILDTVIGRADLAAGLKVLDIGIGTGLLTERLPRGLELYGVDLSPRMLDKLREKKLPVDLALGDFCHLPHPGETFDRIISTFAFHHVGFSEKAAALAEMDRVLKPGGLMVIGDFMVENEAQKESLRAKFRAENRADMLQELVEEYFTDLEEACATLGALGYRTTYRRGATLSWILRAVKAPSR